MRPCETPWDKLCNKLSFTRFTTVMKDVSCRWVLQRLVDYRNYTPSEGMHFGLPMQCNYVFDTQYKCNGLIWFLKEHSQPVFIGNVLNISGVTCGYFKCGLCHERFSVKRNLKRHNKSVHDGTKPVHCQLSKESFSVIWYLKKHIESVHEWKKLFNVNFVRKVFHYKATWKGTLNQFM